MDTFNEEKGILLINEYFKLIDYPWQLHKFLAYILNSYAHSKNSKTLNFSNECENAFLTLLVENAEKYVSNEQFLETEKNYNNNDTQNAIGHESSWNLLENYNFDNYVMFDKSLVNVIDNIFQEVFNLILNFKRFIYLSERYVEELDYLTSFIIKNNIHIPEEYVHKIINNLTSLKYFMTDILENCDLFSDEFIRSIPMQFLSEQSGVFPQNVVLFQECVLFEFESLSSCTVACLDQLEYLFKKETSIDPRRTDQSIVHGIIMKMELLGNTATRFWMDMYKVIHFIMEQEKMFDRKSVIETCSKAKLTIKFDPFEYTSNQAILEDLDELSGDKFGLGSFLKKGTIPLYSNIDIKDLDMGRIMIDFDKHVSENKLKNVKLENEMVIDKIKDFEDNYSVALNKIVNPFFDANYLLDEKPTNLNYEDTTTINLEVGTFKERSNSTSDEGFITDDSSKSNSPLHDSIEESELEFVLEMHDPERSNEIGEKRKLEIDSDEGVDTDSLSEYNSSIDDDISDDDISSRLVPTPRKINRKGQYKVSIKDLSSSKFDWQPYLMDYKLNCSINFVNKWPGNLFQLDVKIRETNNLPVKSISVSLALKEFKKDISRDISNLLNYIKE